MPTAGPLALGRRSAGGECDSERGRRVNWFDDGGSRGRRELELDLAARQYKKEGMIFETDNSLYLNSIHFPNALSCKK